MRDLYSDQTRPRAKSSRRASHHLPPSGQLPVELVKPILVEARLDDELLDFTQLHIFRSQAPIRR